MPRRTNTRERLIETATELFCQQGYAHTGVNEIMQQAQTTSGSFYHFFPTKEDLVLAVIDHIDESFDTVAFATESEDAPDPLDRVFAVVASYRHHLEESDFALGSPLGTLAAELAESHPQVRERLAALFSGWTQRMRKLLEDAGDRLPANLDRRACAEFILSTLEGAVIQARVHRSLAPFDGAVSELRRHLTMYDEASQAAHPPTPQPQPATRTRSNAVDWRAW